MPARSTWLALLLGAWALAACGLPEGDYFGKVPEDPDPTHLRWCNSGEPEYIDPAMVTGTTGLPLAHALFDGLTDHDLNAQPEPSLATHWDISPDQRRFVFHLHDRGRWSNGRAITSHDFVYHMARVLHPLTFSRNAEMLWRLKNGRLYTDGRVKQVLRRSGPFRAGDVVEVLGVAGVDAGGDVGVIELPGTGLPELVDPSRIAIPDSNLRTSDRPLHLRDQGAPESEAYAVVPPGEEVTVVELSDLAHPERGWAYVHWAEGDGVYGWVPAERLTGQPNGHILYWVRAVPRPHRVGVDVPPDSIAAELAAPQPTARVRGADLLMVPEVLGIRTPDPQTLVLETWGPVPYLIDLTPQRIFRPTPREAVSRWPLRWARSADLIVTSGPFHLAGWHERDRIELVRSETFWRREDVALERITAYSIADQSATTNYYMQGGCDAITGNAIPTSYLAVLNGEKRGGRPYRDYVAAPYLGSYFFIINVEKVRSVHLRRALNFAVDRSPIPRILHGDQTPSAQYTPGVPIHQLSDEDLALCGVTRHTSGVAMIVVANELCYVPPPGLDFDPAMAREELAMAREELGADFPEVLSVKFNVGVEGHKLMSEYLQSQWQEHLDLRVELSAQEWKTYLKATSSGEFDIGRLGWIGDFPDPESQFLSNFKCSSPINRTRWCSQEFERLFQQLEATPDRKQRLALLRQAEAVMIREAPIIPLYVYTQHHLQKPYVRDLAINFPNQPPLFRAWIDPAWRVAGRGEAP